MSKEDNPQPDLNTGDRFTPPGLTLEMACRSDKITAFIRARLSRFPFTKQEQEDVAQNVEQALVTGFATFKPSEPFRPWLSTLVDREAKRYLKKQRQYNAPLTREQSFLDDLPDLVPIADDALVQKQRAELVRETIEAMRPPLRELGRLYLSGLAVEQAAEVLGIPHGTAWSRFDEIKKKVKQAEEQRRRKETPFSMFALPWVSSAIFGEASHGGAEPSTAYRRAWTYVKERTATIGLFGAGAVAGGMAVYFWMLSHQTVPALAVAAWPSVQVEAAGEPPPGASLATASSEAIKSQPSSCAPDHAPLATARIPGAQVRAPRDLAREKLDAAGAGAERRDAAEVRALLGRASPPPPTSPAALPGAR